MKPCRVRWHSSALPGGNPVSLRHASLSSPPLATAVALVENPRGMFSFCLSTQQPAHGNRTRTVSRRRDQRRLSHIPVRCGSLHSLDPPSPLPLPYVPRPRCAVCTSLPGPPSNPIRPSAQGCLKQSSSFLLHLLVSHLIMRQVR